MIVPAIRRGATVMDSIFGDTDEPDDGDGQPGTAAASMYSIMKPEVWKASMR